jgi:hypothetical protein
MRQLWKSHRVFGFEVARTAGPDGVDLVILETAEHTHAVSPAHLLMPVGDREVEFDVLVGLTEVAARARFLGLDDAAIRRAFEQAIGELA